MTEFWIKAAQLLLSLSILVTLHELGHFIPARLFGTRVKKFYLFFDFLFPLPNVLNFSLFKIKRGETEYGIGWFPMGGYVQIDGMVDESMDTEALKQEPKPWEFRSKPAWQRLIIMLGGVIVNLILGFVIYAMVLFAWGEERLPIANNSYGVIPDSVMVAHGFQEGDRILRVKDGSAEYFTEINADILINGARVIEVERAGETLDVVLPDSIEAVLISEEVKAPFFPIFPLGVAKVEPGMSAEAIGLEPGDRIYAVNGEVIEDFRKGVQLIKANKGNSVELEIHKPGGDVVQKTAEVDSSGRIGFVVLELAFLDVDTFRYGFFESIPAAFVKTGNNLGKYISSLKLIFTKEGASKIGGFGAIGSMFSGTWDWRSFWAMTAFLSLILAFMNILPIPALDGGHVLFLLYEIVTGRKPGDKFLEYAQTVGMVLLLALLVYANGNDVLRLFN